MIAGIDVGFGWTKIVKDEEETKFPTWIAHHIHSPFSDEINTIKYGSKEYTVGEDVIFENQRIEITGIKELITYFPVFLKHIENIYEEKIEKIVTGIPVIYKDMKDELKKNINGIGVEIEVLPQGLGIFLDVKKQLTYENAFILDIGFNTLDYLIVKKEKTGWKRKKGNTIEKMGIVRAIDRFRELIPKEISYARNFSFSRLLEIFERGAIIFENEKIDLKNIKNSSLEDYTETVNTRLSEEIGQTIYDVQTVVIAGGGANIVKFDLFKHSHIIIPEKPEFSQARGYLNFAMGVEEL